MLTNLTLKIFKYITSKLAGAGLLLFILFVILLVFSTGFNLYQLVEELSSPNIWFLIYIYGVLSSIVIDLIVHKLPKLKRKLNVSEDTFKASLYAVAGFGVFQIWGLDPFTIFVGVIGAGSAFIFYLSTRAAEQVKSFRYLFAILIPLFICILLTIDFTSKSGWTEERTDSSYAASFDYLNGRHEIPIHLEEGEVFTVTYEFNNANGAGHGFHIRNDKNQYVGMEHINDDPFLLQLNVEETGTYKVVVTGYKVSGNFTVDWNID
ncbi:hypothetical protein BpOF4_17430 [Alkalihalophilus pseudofirmus OF4]|uniref:Uncharacterized protein n=1 Tax=Alkalihalophilus pseudofirmus (strain ATCC BAA-2126 / JCM 17055 / OF4) TaxID=398511 RepID=D3FRD6_ALKPO|nr:hypothetical protein [Alkalihalophilus pseudofirmus]ADC51527.1 hypothetical protein BpOF4_17430 [Alkalihalophilus pseudofirmus OF4]